jgi:hypothetical protein
MKKMLGVLRILLVAAGLALAARAGSAAEEKTLLGSDGTLYVARAGSALDLGASGNSIAPTDSLIEFSFQRQDGSRGLGIVPGTIGTSTKSNLDMAYDEVSGSLLLLWKEDFRVVNLLHLGIYRNGAWTQADLLPSLGFAHAFNPQMLLLHQTVHSLDPDGNDRSRVRTILSVIWFEESYYFQARYAPIFLDEDSTSKDVQVYDLPATIGGGGPTPHEGIPESAYMYPALQSEGPGGSMLASFADLHARKHYVVRIDFPTNLGNPSDSKNPIFERRHIPVVGIVASGPLAFEVPSQLAPENAPVGTIIGSSYNPTLYWQNGSTIRYRRFDGKAWSEARAIALGKDLNFDRALRLLEAMAASN